MRLEDSLLYLILDTSCDGDPVEFCSAAIAGGVDVVHIPSEMSDDADVLASVGDVCRRDDAMLIISDNAVLAMELEAGGVHLSSATDSVGQARAMVGVEGLVGMSTQSANDAILGIEVGVDYLLHWSGRGCPAAFSGLPGATACTLFAAGLESLDDARAVVDGGVYRLCVEGRVLSDGDVAENAAAFSRILGRSM